MCEIIIEHVLPPSDSNRLEKLLLELDEVITPKLSSRVKIEEYAKKLSENAELFYVCDEGKDIGNCAIYLNNGEGGYISSIALKKDWQRRGMGSLLWNAVLDCAKAKKIKYIDLMVSQFNSDAIAFYKKLHFEQIEVSDKWIKMRYEMGERFE